MIAQTDNRWEMSALLEEGKKKRAARRQEQEQKKLATEQAANEEFLAVVRQACQDEPAVLHPYLRACTRPPDFAHRGPHDTVRLEMSIPQIGSLAVIYHPYDGGTWKRAKVYVVKRPVKVLDGTCTVYEETELVTDLGESLALAQEYAQYRAELEKRADEMRRAREVKPTVHAEPEAWELLVDGIEKLVEEKIREMVPGDFLAD